MPVCNVKLVVEPWDVAIWITAEPVPGNPGSPNCGPQNWPEDSIETSNGAAIVPLICGERYCLKYRRPAITVGRSGGRVSLYCEGAETPFIRIPFQIGEDGTADGQACFVVDCQEGGAE